MKFDKIIFDVSGTLWDDSEQVFVANYNVLSGEGYTKFPDTDIPLSVEGLKARAKGSCVEMYRYFRMDGSDKELIEKYKLALDEVVPQHPVKLYDGVVDLINSIDGKAHKFIISAHPQHRLDEDLDAVGIYDAFQEILGDCYYKAAVIRDKVKNSSCSAVPYIGDTASDIIFSKRAGALSLAVTYGYGRLEDIIKQEPHRHFPCPYSLKNYLVERI